MPQITEFMMRIHFKLILVYFDISAVLRFSLIVKSAMRTRNRWLSDVAAPCRSSSQGGGFWF